jgi:hypothetical protein
MTDALLPCPFCGNPMEWRAGGYAAHTIPSASCPLADHGFAIVTAWNTRTDAAQAKIAELENALAAASGTIAAMRADVATDQARIAELEAALEEIGHMGFDMPATLDLTEDAWRRRRTGMMQHVARAALKAKT